MLKHGAVLTFKRKEEKKNPVNEKKKKKRENMAYERAKCGRNYLQKELSLTRELSC